MTDEIIDFIEDIEDLLSKAEQIPGQVHQFNPILFFLWKISKQLEPEIKSEDITNGDKRETEMP